MTIRFEGFEGSIGSWVVVDAVAYDPDVRLMCRVKYGGFEGEADTWVLDSQWGAFVRAMGDLERTRTGKATIESISPGELRLSVEIRDPLGHCAVSGMVGTAGIQSASLSFGAIEIDPTTLPGLARSARQAVLRPRGPQEP